MISVLGRLYHLGRSHLYHLRYRFAAINKTMKGVPGRATHHEHSGTCTPCLELRLDGPLSTATEYDLSCRHLRIPEKERWVAP